jgi:hypothetical protein
MARDLARIASSPRSARPLRVGNTGIGLLLLLKPSITRFELAETWFESGPLASMHHACTCFGLGFFYNDELSKIQSMDHFLGVFSLSRKSCPVDFRRIFDNVDALCKTTTETLA